jgi:drug/metabolite transporter (DMT)-like permease
VSFVTLAALSAVFLGLYDVSKKAALNHNAVLPVLWLSTLSSLALLVLVLGVSVIGRSAGAAPLVSLEPLTAAEHLLILLKAGIVSLSWVLSFFAIKHLPISLSAPVRASAPVFTVLGALVIFGETPSLSQWAGIAFVLAAYLAFSVIGRGEGILFQTNRYVWLLLGGTLLGAASALYDKHLLQGAALPVYTLQLWFSA